ncbi:MAG: helix-turn-helix domain-containing protein [Muribaculaceae bacterium]|nr:helix-turn-helix domain-containing protein [Muribaculaceae bacterium]
MRIQRKCEICGNTFTIRSGNQHYCSESCAESAKIARKKRRNDFIKAVEPLIDLRQQEYFTFSKAALLMGCTRQYIYKLVAQGKLQASRLSNRMSLIRKADIEKLLSSNPYERVIPVIRKPESKPKSQLQPKGKSISAKSFSSELTDPIEYYTGEDVMSRFKIGQGWLYTCAKKYHIRVCKIAGKLYFNKHDIDEHFGIQTDYSNITDWLTTLEVEEQFNMGATAIRAYAYRHNIPTKKEYGIAYYSKSHLEELRRPNLIADDRYCTVEETAEKYGLTKANLHHIVNVKGIRKVKVGVRNLLSREDVERVMAERAALGM